MVRSSLFLIVVGLLAGCAAPKVGQLPHPATTVPADALITQRGVISFLGRQLTLNGYLAVSATGGKRLVMTENFGGVLADVLIKPDGQVYVMRSSRAFKEKWIRRYVAADVQCLFGGSATNDCPGVVISPTHFTIERRWYKLDLRIVDIKPGAQSTTMFDETKAGKR